MAVLKVVEQYHLRTGGFGPATANSVRIFLVQFDTPVSDESLALFATDPNTSLAIPAWYSTHPTRNWLVATDLNARNCADKPGGTVWEVMVTYGFGYATPWQQPVQVSGDQTAYQKIIDYDVQSGKLVTNSAGFKFDPPAMGTRHNATLSFQKALQTFDTTIPGSWVDKVNSDTFYGYAAGYVMCAGIPWQLAYWTSPTGVATPYYNVTFNFEIKNSQEHSWQPIIADQGFYQLNAGGTAVKPILDPLFGQPVTQPWPLDGSGHAQPGPTFSYIGKNFNTYYTGTFATLTALWS